MSDWQKDFTSLGHAVIRKTRLSNAMGAPLVVVVVIALPSFIIAGLTQFWPILLLAMIPLLYFLYAFDYIMKKNPSLLRTEEHEEKMLQIQMGAMGEKNDELTEEDVDELPAVAETVPKKIEGARK